MAHKDKMFCFLDEEITLNNINLQTIEGVLSADIGEAREAINQISQDDLDESILSNKHNESEQNEDDRKLLNGIDSFRNLITDENRDKKEPLFAILCMINADYLSLKGEKEEAEKLYLEALGIRRRLAKEVDPKKYEPEVADTCDAIAEFYYKEYRIDEAEKYYFEEIKIYRNLSRGAGRKTYGPKVARLYNNIGHFYESNDMRAEADQMYAKSIKRFRHLPGAIRQKYEYDMTKAILNLGHSYFSRRYTDKAKKLYFEAFKIFIRAEKTMEDNIEKAKLCKRIAYLCNVFYYNEEANEYTQKAEKIEKMILNKTEE